MVLAAPVRHPNVDSHVLLQARYRTESDTKAQLERFGISAVWVRHPGFDFLDDRLCDEIPRARVRLYESVKRNFSGIADTPAVAFDLYDYRTTIGTMIMAVVANKSNAILAERLMNGDSELFSHCSNVAYLSIVIGMRIKNYVFAERKYIDCTKGTDLTNLGIGAMLHDLGKLELNPEWHDSHFFSEDNDTADYRSHVERGYRFVQGRLEASASQILLHHHQRFDGKGWPDLTQITNGRVQGNQMGGEIHVFSRIVAATNVLDNLLRDADGTQRPPVAALSEFASSRFDGWFDPIVRLAVLQRIPPLAVGSQVDLNDDRPAVVVAPNLRRPCRPSVRLLDDSAQAAVETCTVLDLVDHPELHIVRDAGVDVKKWLFELPNPRPTRTRQSINGTTPESP